MRPEYLFGLINKLPLTAGTDPTTLASTLDRIADHALAHGRAIYAEHLAHRAEELRGSGQ